MGSELHTQPSGYPVFTGSLPTEAIDDGKYEVRFARTQAELEAVQRLRFEIFNLELGEGLDESHSTGMDVDRFANVVKAISGPMSLLHASCANTFRVLSVHPSLLSKSLLSPAYRGSIGYPADSKSISIFHKATICTESSSRPKGAFPPASFRCSCRRSNKSQLLCQASFEHECFQLGVFGRLA